MRILTAHQQIEIAAIEANTSLDPSYAAAAIAAIKDSFPIIQGTVMAKSIRRILKAAFPGTKFSVTKGRRLGGTVRWTDGPCVDMVKKTLGAFDQNTFVDWANDYSESHIVFISADGRTSYNPSEGFIPFFPITEFRYSREVSDEVGFAAVDAVRDCLNGQLRFSRRSLHKHAGS